MRQTGEHIALLRDRRFAGFGARLFVGQAGGFQALQVLLGARDDFRWNARQLRYGLAVAPGSTRCRNTIRSLCSVAFKCTLVTSGSLSGSTVSSK